jgi:hypothetical protein
MIRRAAGPVSRFAAWRDRITEDALPSSSMPDAGWDAPHNLRARPGVVAPVHRASSRTLGAALPFLAESGEPMAGAYVGPNLLSRSTFCFDPWEAYAAGIVRSHSVAVFGVKGSGKSVLAKSLSTRLCRLGRKVAVPHDPNGEWTRVAAYVGGATMRLGPGQTARINPLDPGPRRTDVSNTDWAQEVLQFQRAKVRAMVAVLRNTTELSEIEHTAIDLALEQVQSGNSTTLVPMVWEALRNPAPHIAEEIGAGGQMLAHTLRRVTVGDLADLMDRPSTVVFDAATPMLTVDTSGLARASAETKALLRLATTDWIERGTPAGEDQARLIVHEEAAVALLNEVAGGGNLVGRVSEEKTARHRMRSNCYLIHRINDFDALGDRGSALHAQALGLLADCDTRVNYAQHTGELERSAQVLGWNRTQAELVRKLRRGEGFWQIGPERVAKVRNDCTPGELAVFRTDGSGTAPR